MAKTVAKEKDGNTKERILRAAIGEFVEYGFYGARTQKIADKAKVNKALLHYYFSSKEKIYEEALKTIMEVIVAKLSALKGEPEDPAEMMAMIIDAYAEVFQTHSQYFKLLLYEVIRGGDKLIPLFKTNLLRIPINPINGKIYMYFKKKMKEGKIRKMNVFHLLLSLVVQVAPVYFVREAIGDKVKLFGISDMVLNNFAKERKLITLEVMKHGVLK